MRKRPANVKIALRFRRGLDTMTRRGLQGLSFAATTAYLSVPQGAVMKFKLIVHEAEEGGYWAEVPAVPGCASEGETMEELLANIREAIEGCLSVELPSTRTERAGRILEISF